MFVSILQEEAVGSWPASVPSIQQQEVVAVRESECSRKEATDDAAKKEGSRSLDLIKVCASRSRQRRTATFYCGKF
jgi:hypothetical protein